MTSPDQAQSALDEIERVVAGTRRAIVAVHAADHLIVWGIVWALGFGAMHATTWHPGWVWLPLVAAGSVLSAGIGLRAGRVVESGDSARILWFFVVLALFAGIWAVLLHPFNVEHFSAYLATVFMFAYVAGGLWFGRFFVLLGAGVTLAALLAVLVAPAALGLVMATAGGGSLLASGLYIRLTWT